MTGFMLCPNCGFSWMTRSAFLDDEHVFLVGYQVNFVSVREGFFLFNHVCGTTFTVGVREFADLHHGPVFSGKLTGTDACPGHCLHKNNLEPCPAECECAFVRDIIQQIKKN